ncbi:C1q-like domain-containing protein [Ectobacillus funiculus]|uniref:C1q-like domain-containing protein n=1 Tax=Ectobacillus funiculus TaxID=137993 RepID=UPI00101BED06|nr:hypothetical protein [Ectobacillus funiculus]
MGSYYDKLSYQRAKYVAEQQAKQDAEYRAKHGYYYQDKCDDCCPDKYEDYHKDKYEDYHKDKYKDYHEDKCEDYHEDKCDGFYPDKYEDYHKDKCDGFYPDESDGQQQDESDGQQQDESDGQQQDEGDGQQQDESDDQQKDESDDHQKDKTEDYSKAKSDDQSRDKKQNPYYPTVNVNAWGYKKGGKKKNARKSAFTATKAVGQTVPGTGEVKVFFQKEQFDLADEYDSIASAFIPKEKGLYSIIASVSFAPRGLPTGAIHLQIRVNGNIVASDSEVTTVDGSVSVATILELQANDRVEVFFASDNKGVIRTESAKTQFEGLQVG